MWREFGAALEQMLEGLRNILRGIFGLPLRVVRDISQAVLGRRGGGGHQADEEPAAEQRSSRSEAVREVQRDNALDGLVVLHAFRRAAAAKSDGLEADAKHVAALPPSLRTYLDALTPAECAAVSRKSISNLRALVENRSPRTDVRSPAEVESAAETEPEPDAPIDLAARRDALRTAARAAMRGEKPVVVDADEARLEAMGL